MSGPSDNPAAAYPTWLKPLRVPLTVIIGPAGNGALAFAREQAGPGELVLDIAAIVAELSNGVAGDWTIPAFRQRNETLERMTDADRAAKAGITGAWLVSPSPFQWQRDFWSSRGAMLLLRDPGKERAIAGAIAAGVPVKFVHQWYAQAADAMAGMIAPPVRQAPPRADREQEARPPSSKRGYGREHRVLRDEQLAREPHCRMCAEASRVTPATVLDHIEPFHDAGGEFIPKRWGDPKNHRSLCAACHDARGARRNRPERPPGVAGDGRPQDPAHPWNRRS